MQKSDNRQYNTKYRTLIPPNLFGFNDNFNLSTAHVLPSLLFKFHNAKKKSLKSVNVWGSGEQTREFLYVKDLSNLSSIVKLMLFWKQKVI